MIKNMVADTSARLDREALFARSEALHQLAADHFHALAAFLSPVRARVYAKQLARLRADVWPEDDSQAVFVSELAAWTAEKGRSTALERYARQKILLAASAEAAVLAGMQASIISFWTVQEAHPVAGWIVRDLGNEGTVWIVDEGLEHYLKASGSTCFLARFFRSEQDGFWMICSDMFGISETLATFGAGKEAAEGTIQSASEQHVVRSREAAFVSVLYAMVPPVGE